MMRSAIALRPVRIVAAAFVLISLYIVSQHLNWVTERAGASLYPPDLPVGSPESTTPGQEESTWPAKPPSLPGDSTTPTEFRRPPLDAEPATGLEGLVEEAHKLPFADAFLNHFKAVRNLPGITLAEAKAGCNWLAPDQVNFQYGKDDDWVQKDRSDVELGQRRTQWYEFMENGLLKWSDYQDRFVGRGIVIVAGNGKSVKRVQVILRALTKLGSQMPIEIHYWGNEMPLKDQQELQAMWPLTYFNDLSSPANIIRTNVDNIFNVNYQLKTAAVVNSRFAEVLLMDSDNIPVVDPETLFGSAVYMEYGTVFWPDIARTRPENPMWAITNTACKMDEYELESGQLMVDKRRYFYHLQLAAWWNNEHAPYYCYFLLGDKDMFRFAWHALKTAYGRPSRWLTSVGTLTEGFYCGHTFAQHDPDGGHVAFLHGGLIKHLPKDIIRWQRDTRGGIFQFYKRSDADTTPQVNVNVRIKFDTAPYPPIRAPDAPGGQCTDIFDALPRPLDDIVPGFEKTFAEIGGYWMLDEDGL